MLNYRVNMPERQPHISCAYLHWWKGNELKLIPSTELVSPAPYSNSPLLFATDLPNLHYTSTEGEADTGIEISNQ